MGIVQFLRIIWARRLLVLAATASCVVGAYIVTLILPPRWEAHSRVMLDVVKPDPVTGQIIATQFARAYTRTQVELVRDYRVAGQVADQLGWLSDPNMVALYDRRPSNDHRDFRRFIAQMVIDNTKADLIEGSNILEITYVGTTAEQARLVADALRKAYIDSSLAFRRDDANRDADWFAAQADKAKAALDAAVAAKTAYERQNGLVMEDEKTDVDTARLRSLAAQAGGGAPMIAAGAQESAASGQLAQVDAEIALQAKTLGPNHPELVALRARRDVLARQAARDEAALRAAGGAAANAAASAGAGALDRAVQTQKSRVIAEGDKLGRLTQLQAEVNLRRDLFNKTAARAADLRLEAQIGDTGLTPLGSAVTPKAPAFPNMPLIIFGSLGLGLGVGVLVALLSELFGRRVRGVEDLRWTSDIPVLAVIAKPQAVRSDSPSRRRSMPFPGSRRRKVRA